MVVLVAFDLELMTGISVQAASTYILQQVLLDQTTPAAPTGLAERGAVPAIHISISVGKTTGLPRKLEVLPSSLPTAPGIRKCPPAIIRRLSARKSAGS